jgi:predicted metal-dependent peptidase
MARDDWSLARPNSRYIDQGIVLPGPYSDKAGQLVLSVDSSGSMSAPLLEAVGAELNAIAREAEEITIIVSDSRVRQVVKEADVAWFLANLKLKGGGGTDHRPVFDYLKAARITPDLFIGLTDLYTVLPPKKPPFPVLWAVPPKHAAAPWGHTVVFTPQPTPPDINNIVALINNKRGKKQPGGPPRLAIPLHR